MSLSSATNRALDDSVHVALLHRQNAEGKMPGEQHKQEHLSCDESPFSIGCHAFDRKTARMSSQTLRGTPRHQTSALKL